MRFFEAVVMMKLRLEDEVAGRTPAQPSTGEAGEKLVPRIDPVPLMRAFQVLQSVDAVVSLQEVAGTDRLLEEAAAAGVELSYSLLLQEVRLTPPPPPLTPPRRVDTHLHSVQQCMSALATRFCAVPQILGRQGPGTIGAPCEPLSSRLLPVLDRG